MRHLICNRLLIIAWVLFACLPAIAGTNAIEDRSNVLIITVDDMSCDSVGVYGSRLADTTPNMDSLAKSALRFKYAHVQVGNCMPSRNVMWSGRYPHNNGVEGFYQVPNQDYPVLCDLAQEAGYHTSIRHKVNHSTPYTPYGWDLDLDKSPDGTAAHTKDAASYGVSTTQAIEAAKAVGKPFCAIINISDPHKPFYSQVKQGKDPFVPSRVFHADEVPVPGFLPEDDAVKAELALYYSSVRRADDAVGAILNALDASGYADNTMVMFLSDHGMPLPFAKTQLYHHSTRTPLMIRWPGVTAADTIDEVHMVSAVDFLPTLSEIMNFECPSDLDGRSFAALLRGETQSDRNFVIKEYNENSGAKRNPMRAIETREYLYLFNPWSNGMLPMATATNGTATWKRMKQLAQSDPEIQKRVELMEHREREELYHVADDPDCLVNLINDPDHRASLEAVRRQLLAELQRTGDPIAELLENREVEPLIAEYMLRSQAEADARRKPKKSTRAKSAQASTKSASGAKLVPSKSPAEKLIRTVSVNREGQQLIAEVNFKLSDGLGAQKLFVTLKSADGTRVARKQLDIKGSGTVSVNFDLPAELHVESAVLAAFVGEDFPHCLHHVSSPLKSLMKKR